MTARRRERGGVMETYYKALTADGLGPFSRFEWPLPNADQPGDWVEVSSGEIVPCERGIHACTRGQIVEWLDASLYEIEYDDAPIDAADKVVGRHARLVRRLDTWNEVTARLFAADCAERVAHLHIPLPGSEWRPEHAIDAAARAAAWSAAWDAAWDAAAVAAAGVAAWDAARAAAWDAAWAAERAWQTARLWAYLDGEIDVSALLDAIRAEGE